MPLSLYHSIENAEIAVWRATEEIDFYKEYLAKNHFPTHRANLIKRPENIRQWYASRYLLCQLFPGAIQMYRERKPYLYNGPEISFSHSEDMVALMLSSFKSGIDIQVVNEKLERIAPKFVNPSDLKAIPFSNSLQQLCVIWSIKEAVFKYYTTELPFKQIRIQEYDLINNIANIEVTRRGKLQNHLVGVMNLGDFTMAYVIE